MKALYQSLLSTAVAASLAGGLAAASETRIEETTATVGDIVMPAQLPEEVQTGSIPIPEHPGEDEEKALAGLATVAIEEAAGIARGALPGSVVEAKLEDENGFLIWEVEMVGPGGQEAVLMIDAGNGDVLAGEPEEDHDGHENREGEHEGHQWWKFWDDDRDEHGQREG